MKYKNMKIKVDDSNRQDVMHTLLNEGYRLCDIVGVHFEYDAAKAFLVYDNSDVLRKLCGQNWEYTFNIDRGEEHFWVNGKIVTKDYWTQPATRVIPEKTNAQIIGIRSRKEHDQARIKDIAEAIVRYVDADKAIPSEWTDELNELLRMAKLREYVVEDATKCAS